MKRIISTAPVRCPIDCSDPIVARENPYLAYTPEQHIASLEYEAEHEEYFMQPLYLFRTEVSFR